MIVRQLGDITVLRIIEHEIPVYHPSDFFDEATLEAHREWLEPKALCPQTGNMVKPVHPTWCEPDTIVSSSTPASVVTNLMPSHPSGTRVATKSGCTISPQPVCNPRTSISCSVRICTQTIAVGIRGWWTVDGCQHSQMPNMY